jgi:hypothetical protein
LTRLLQSELGVLKGELDVLREPIWNLAFRKLNEYRTSNVEVRKKAEARKTKDRTSNVESQVQESRSFVPRPERPVLYDPGLRKKRSALG